MEFEGVNRQTQKERSAAITFPQKKIEKKLDIARDYMI